MEDLNRREFLKKFIIGLGGMMGAVMGVFGGAYFLSPLWTKEKEEWADLGEVTKIPVGVPTKMEFVQRKRDGWVVVEGRSSAWVVTPNGKNFAVYDPHCTHLGCPFRWDESKKSFLCPCHNGVFAMDGNIVSGPVPRPLDRYPYKVVGGKLFIKPQVVPAPA